MSEYIPSPTDWVAKQVELYESSQGTEGLTLRNTNMPVIIVTNRGWKTGAIRKTPFMRVVDGDNYVLVASQGGAPKHPLWYHNLKADPHVEIRDKTEVYHDACARSHGPGGAPTPVGPRRRSLPAVCRLPAKDGAPDPGLRRRTHRLTGLNAIHRVGACLRRARHRRSKPTTTFSGKVC